MRQTIQRRMVETMRQKLEVKKSKHEEEMKRMVEMTLRMEKPLTNALGENWRDKMTEPVIRALYAKM